MTEKVVCVRLIASTGHCIKLRMKCPVPTHLEIPEFDGTITTYKRRFALLEGGKNFDVLEVFFYENATTRLEKN